MEYSSRQLNRMQRSAPTQWNGRALPSLQEACRKRCLFSDGSDDDLRRRLKRFKTNLPRLEALQCAICSDVSTVDELVIVCDNGHHVCFECAVGMARQPAARHACPMRCDSFGFRPPNHLLRRLAEPLVKDVAPSPAFALYQKLSDAGVVPLDLDVSTLRFMGIVMHCPEARALATRVCHNWRHHLDLMRQLNQTVSCNTPRHVRFVEDSSDEDDDTQEDTTRAPSPSSPPPPPDA